MSVRMTVQNLRSLLVPALTALLISVMLGVTLHPASGFAEEHTERKVRSRVYPAYPDIARKMALTGVVRIEVTISAAGQIKETKVIGGHPILVTAAVDAVKKWKFDPASSDTTETLEFKFDPGN